MFKLIKFIIFLVIIAGIFFLGYFGGVAGWLPAITNWFSGMIKK